jgi:predicted transcriptional regulator
MTILKNHLLSLIQERERTIDELASLLKTSKHHVLHLLFRLQEEGKPIVIQQGTVYIDSDNPWAYVAGVFAILAFILAVIGVLT